MKQIILKEGQSIFDTEGNEYITEKSDVLKEANIDNATRKIFISYAEEVIENVLDYYPNFSFDTKGLWQIVSVMGNMALPEDNSNYRNSEKYFPKKFNKVLFDNGEGNAYDSAWMIIRDEQQFKIINQAAKNLGVV